MIVILSLLSTATLSAVHGDDGTATVVLRRAHSALADNGTATEADVGGVSMSGLRENDRGRNARQAAPDGDEDRRGQRCALAAIDEGDGDGDTVLEEATRTVHRYRLKPAAAHFENSAPLLFPEKPVAMYVRRRRPVVVVARPAQKNFGPITAADDVRYNYYERPAVPFASTAVRGPPPPLVRVGVPFNVRVLVQDGRRRQTDGRYVSLTSDEVSRLLRRVFSEDVVVAEATAEAV